QTGNPQTGNPQTGNPQVGNPQTGNPQAGNPQVGNPQAGNPQQGGRGQRPPRIESPEHKNAVGGFFYTGKAFPTMTLTGMGFSLPLWKDGEVGFTKTENGSYINDPQKFSTYFGYFAAGPRSAIFYQGNNLTAESEIPQSGTAKYVGDSIYVTKGKVTTQVGKVDLTADFVNKNLTGTVFAAEGGIDSVTVNARLDKNTFAGEAVQNGQKADLHGKFYGKNATELAGSYSDASSILQGAFGAKKQ
ncbi:transferrin-binding protein-like solute binding protein, partial [Ursidibacter sp. B-7004-1]